MNNVYKKTPLEECEMLDSACKLCLQPVSKNDGLQCTGSCRQWVHFECLNYTPGKITDIKGGIIKVACPCPDCTAWKPKEFPPSTYANRQCSVNQQLDINYPMQARSIHTNYPETSQIPVRERITSSKDYPYYEYDIITGTADGKVYFHSPVPTEGPYSMEHVPIMKKEYCPKTSDPVPPKSPSPRQDVSCSTPCPMGRRCPGTSIPSPSYTMLSSCSSRVLYSLEYSPIIKEDYCPKASELISPNSPSPRQDVSCSTPWQTGRRCPGTITSPSYTMLSSLSSKSSLGVFKKYNTCSKPPSTSEYNIRQRDPMADNLRQMYNTMNELTEQMKTLMTQIDTCP